MTQPISDERSELSPEWLDDTEQDRFNAVIRKVAAEDQVDLVDLVTYIAKIDVEGLSGKVFYDGLHVTDIGSSLYADCISERLFQIIGKEHSIGQGKGEGNID